jgi:hypothetical protein
MAFGEVIFADDDMAIFDHLIESSPFEHGNLFSRFTFEESLHNSPW